MTLFEYITINHMQIISLFVEHIKLTFVSVGMAILLGVPLGIAISHYAKASKPILAIANTVQAIPSMALLGFMIPFLGIGKIPAIVAVVLYSLLPIIKNTYTGLENINPQTLESAKGIGLTPMQVLMKIQIPLALPVIMAGVRIASVTAVGLMTIAAFIGAGGLGYLVFSGIRTVNTNQILAGAIPACILALAVDFMLSMVESLVTPTSMQKTKEKIAPRTRRIQKAVIGFVGGGLVVVMLVGMFGGATRSTTHKTLVIGAKDYTEQAIMGNIVADMIEAHTDIRVERKLDLGGTKVCFAALIGGDIDMYMEYSGTAYADTLKHPPISDVQKVYNTIKAEFKEKYNMEVLEQLSFNNTYTMAVTREFARKYGLENISDLRKVAADMKSGTTFEFSNRDDGLPGLEKTYRFKIGQTLTVDGSPRYAALVNGEVDVVDAFSTDGLLKKFDLKTLRDDKNFFPPYRAMPIIRAESLAKNKEIVPVLELLVDVLTDDVMIELNYRVDELQESPQTVANSFLKDRGLIPK